MNAITSDNIRIIAKISPFLRPSFFTENITIIVKIKKTIAIITNTIRALKYLRPPFLQIFANN